MTAGRCADSDDAVTSPQGDEGPARWADAALHWELLHEG